MFLENWWDTQNTVEQVFWSVALVFSLLLIMQTLTSVALDHDEEESASADHLLWWLNVRMVLVSITLTGWLGLIVLQFIPRWGTALMLSAVASFALAIGLEFLVAEHYAQRKITERTGKVSESVPPHKIGMGKVRVKGSKQEWRAVTSGKEILPGAPVRIVEQVDEGTIEVEALPQKRKGKNPNRRG